MWLTTLENRFQACSAIQGKVLAAHLAGRAVNDNVSRPEQVGKATSTIVATRAESSDRLRFIRSAVKREAASHCEVAAEAGASLCNAHNGHVVLRRNCVGDTLAYGAIAVDSYPDGHAGPFGRLLKSVVGLLMLQNLLQLLYGNGL